MKKEFKGMKNQYHGFKVGDKVVRCDDKNGIGKKIIEFVPAKETTLHTIGAKMQWPNGAIWYEHVQFLLHAKK